MDATSVLLLGVTPVSDTAPAGQDARYEPEYAALLAEVEKLGSVTQAGNVSWAAMADSAAVVLRDKSKDFQAGCYLAVALAEVQGIAGVPTGTHVLRDLVCNYWDNGFPTLKRLRGRINAFDWWRERLLARLQAALDSPPLEAVLCRAVTDELRALDQALGEVMPDYPPLRDLLETAGRLPGQVSPSPEVATSLMPSVGTFSAVSSPSPEVSEGQPGAGESAPAATPFSSSEVLPSLAPPQPLGDDAEQNRRLFAEYALSFAFAGQRADPADPLPWQAARAAVWGRISRLPPADGDVTLLPAPDPDRKTVLRGQLEAGKTLEAVLAAENLLPEQVFWLDLQCIVAMGLRVLGGGFAAALAVVEAECALLLRRLPGVERLRYADGMPFADEETRAWLTQIAGQGSGAAFTAEAHTAPAQEHARTLDQAETLYASGDLAGALNILDAALRCAQGGAQRLPLRVGQTRLLIRARQWAAATALAEELLDLCAARDLASWDPEQALLVLETARHAWEGLGGERGTTRAWEIRGLISRVRPAAALDEVQ